MLYYKINLIIRKPRCTKYITYQRALNYNDMLYYTIMTHTHEIDLHGMNMSQARRALDSLFDWLKTHKSIHTLHIVVGVGSRSVHGPVLPSFVTNYLREKNVTGENKKGVIEVHLNTKKHKS